MNGNPVVLAVAAVAILIFLVFLLLFFSVLRLWVQALLCGVPASILDIIGMRLRRTPPQLIVHAAIALQQRGVKVHVREIERCYLAHAIGQNLTSLQLATLYLEKQDKTG